MSNKIDYVEWSTNVLRVRFLLPSFQVIVSPWYFPQPWICYYKCYLKRFSRYWVVVQVPRGSALFDVNKREKWENKSFSVLTCISQINMGSTYSSSQFSSNTAPSEIPASPGLRCRLSIPQYTPGPIHLQHRLPKHLFRLSNKEKNNFAGAANLYSIVWSCRKQPGYSSCSKTSVPISAAGLSTIFSRPSLSTIGSTLILQSMGWKRPTYRL